MTLCKDIVLNEFGSDTTIQSAYTETKGYEYAAVRVQFASQERGRQAVCYYGYDAVDDTALQLSDPLSAYATTPFEVTIDGETLTKAGLAKAVREATLKQGKEFIDRARQGVQDAMQR